MKIPKPRKTIIPRGQPWPGGDYLQQRKYDGRFEPAGVTVGDCRLIAERMTSPPAASGHECQTTGGVWFAVHSVASVAGEGVLHLPTRDRWALAARLARHFPPWLTLAQTGTGPGFAEAVIAAGGEGVCLHHLEAPWGFMLAIKRREVFICRVAALDGSTGGAELVLDDDPAHQVGRVPLRGNKFERVRVGSVLKIEAFGMTPAGKLREARPDADAPDSWLVRY